MVELLHWYNSFLIFSTISAFYFLIRDLMEKSDVILFFILIGISFVFSFIIGGGL